MIRIRGLGVDYEDFHLRDINLDVERGDFFILLGPTGAGKTVLLEAITGVASVSSGTIELGGRDITHLPPEGRQAGIVYQDYALFPHLTVEQNIRYGLRYMKTAPDTDTRFRFLVDELALSGLLHRLPGTLSGGEMQRTALARALVTDPEVLLLDEPLSALDPAFREDIRRMLKQLHADTGKTFVMVTHDFSEALSLGGKGAVIHEGRIRQTGGISEIFRRPATPFVADFVGMKNILEAVFSSDGKTARAGGLEIALAHPAGEDHGFLAVRPEDIVLSTAPLQSSMRNSFPAEITAVIDHGMACEVRLSAGEAGLTAHVTRGSVIDLNLREGTSVWCSFKATAVHRF